MRYESEAGEIPLALTGESLISRKLSVFKDERAKELNLGGSGEIA